MFNTSRATRASKQARRTINLSEFSVSVEKTPRGFCYSSSSEKAEGSMSIIGSSAILNLNLPRLR